MSDAKVHFRQHQAYMLSVANCIVQLIQQYDLDMAECSARAGITRTPSA